LKILVIVRDPIVRLVSDVVHFNAQFKKRADFKEQNVDNVVLGKSKNLPYYPDHDLTVREAVYQLSNYSMVWEQLTAVYPEVIADS